MNSFDETNPSHQPISEASHFSLGQRGEELAAAYLLKQGYALVAANFVIPVGRNRRGAVISVELDLVAYDGETLCFVEVKSRGSDWFVAPQANVDRRKQRQVTRAARAYLRLFDLKEEPYRFDVVTVVMNESSRPDIKLLRNYWTADSFSKQNWYDRHYY